MYAGHSGKFIATRHYKSISTSFFIAQTQSKKHAETHTKSDLLTDNHATILHQAPNSSQNNKLLTAQILFGSLRAPTKTLCSSLTLKGVY